MDKKLLWPSLITMVIFTVLVSLGTWQVNRLYQKKERMAEVSKQVALPPLEVSCSELKSGFNNNYYYRKLRVKGHYLNSNNIFIYAGPMAIRGKPGYFLISEFECADQTKLVVNQGWLEMSTKDQFINNNIEKIVEFDATIMPEETPGRFTPDNDPEKNTWYYINFKDIQKFWNTDPLNFHLMRAYKDSKYPVGKNPVAKMRNDHLSYAITWYGLAVILLVMYYLRFFKPLKTHSL